MPLQIPTRQNVVRSGQGYFRKAVPEWDPSTSRRSYVGGLVVASMSALHDWYVALREAIKQVFPQTAQGTFLRTGWWSDITHLKPNPASAAHGLVVFTGDSGSAIEAGTEITSSGQTYTTDNGVSIVTQSVALLSLTRSGSTVTASTTEPHHLATGMTVAISGATETDYNGDQTIIATSERTFVYAIDTTPTTPATGAPMVTATWAAVSVTCTTKGAAGNRDSGSELAVGTIAGVDATALVTYGGVVGGAAAETDESYRARVLAALGTDFGTFSAGEIEILAKTVTGVTRVWVRKAQISPPAGWPAEGQVFVAFMRDNDFSPFPSAQNIADVYAAIAQVLPAHTAPEDLVVTGPTPQAVDFAFSSVTPDTPTMRAAITASLKQFFAEGVDYGVDIPEDDYRCAIRDTYDPVGRKRLTSFALATLSGDVSVGASSLPTLGSVTF